MIEDVKIRRKKTHTSQIEGVIFKPRELSIDSFSRIFSAHELDAFDVLRVLTTLPEVIGIQLSVEAQAESQRAARVALQTQIQPTIALKSCPRAGGPS